MAEQAKAKIFLSGERGHTETEWFRTYNTFNFGQFQSQYKKPFSALFVWNEDTLAGGKCHRLSVERDSAIFLLPLVGAIQFKNSLGHEYILEAGQSLFCPLKMGTTIEICNPYEDALVSFLQGWIEGNFSSVCSAEIVRFFLDEEKNNLVEITNARPGLKCFAGKFEGRRSYTLPVTRRGNRIFAFVIEGAFEVEDRLLQAKDGLALWDVTKVEFEALSNEAILLVLEMTGEQANRQA